MNKEDKILLLKDLAQRLPYGVYLFIYKHHIRLLTISRDLEYDEQYWINGLYDIDEVKPYLRPMSSMTEEECKELGELPAIIEHLCETLPNVPYYIEVVKPEQIDYLNEHHIDYRGLIPMGLALEAPEGMYK